jgi:hypothetical protein
MRRCLALLALASPLASAPAAAQGGLVPLDSAALAALAPFASRIDSAPELRLYTLWGKSVLVAPRLVPSGIQYQDLTGERPRIDGRAFQLQRRGHATGTGAILGGLLLGALGTGVGVFLTSFACIDAEVPCGPPAQPIIAGAVLGTAVGVIAGGAIGSRVSRWHTVYQHPDP